VDLSQTFRDIHLPIGMWNRRSSLKDFELREFSSAAVGIVAC
jgi:hypothetical protein